MWNVQDDDKSGYDDDMPALIPVGRVEGGESDYDDMPSLQSFSDSEDDSEGSDYDDMPSLESIDDDYDDEDEDYDDED